MSLLKWKEMAKSKSALGKKINFVHNTITKKKLGEETSQIGLEKMFKPITTKLDDVIASNLPQGSLRAQPARKRKAKPAEIDYLPEVDPFEEMDVGGLFDDVIVPPQPEKQIPAAPPTYEEIIQDVGDDPPEYEDESPDYVLKPEDETEDEAEDVTEMLNEYLTELNILSYNTVDTALGSSELSATQKRNYLEKTILPDAIFGRNQLKGYKSSFTKKFNKGEITEKQMKMQHQRIDRSSRVLNEYIKHYKAKQKTLTGSGVRRRKKKVGPFVFSPIPKNFSKNLRSSLAPFLLGIQTLTSEIPGRAFSISS